VAEAVAVPPEPEHEMLYVVVAAGVRFEDPAMATEPTLGSMEQVEACVAVQESVAVSPLRIVPGEADIVTEGTG
jgi:hypothetical protein